MCPSTSPPADAPTPAAASAPPCPTCGAPRPAEAALCPGCLLRAGMSRPPEADALEALLPGLTIHELLGRGGMGAVYRARQEQLDRDVALKLLPAEAAERPGFAERFAREARALARLRHPHIVAVHDHGTLGGHCYLIMEYVAGVDLRRLLRQRKLSAAEALALVPQICDALQYAHEQGVVHRDIKPENILVDAHGRVRIADFGLAKLSDVEEGEPSLLTGRADVLGTPRYMAPEQLEGAARVDHRADIYSLGLVFYEMLTGELPMGRFEPPSQRVAVDVRVDEVVLKALERVPERRWQQAADVAGAVAALGVQGATPPPAEPLPEEDVAGFTWALMSLAVPGFAFTGAIWADSWWPLAALWVPGAAVGSCLAEDEPDGSTLGFVALVGVMITAAVVAALFKLESASPLWAVLLFGLGVAHGHESPSDVDVEPSA